MEQTQETVSEVQTEIIGYEMDETQKIALMAPMLKAMRDIVLQQNLYEKLESQIPNPHPSMNEEKVTEQIVYGLLAHVKYGLSLGEATIVVNEGQAVNWCFDKFVNTDDFKKATEDMVTINVDGNDVSHNIDVKDIYQVANVIQPLIERFNKDLKKSPVCYSKMNYFNIKVKNALKAGESMTAEHAFQAGCGCILHCYYNIDQAEALQLAIDGNAVNTAFEKYMTDTVNAAVGKTVETTVH